PITGGGFRKKLIMAFARGQHEQAKSDPIAGDSQKVRPPVASAPCRSLALNDAHSPALRLGHGFDPSPAPAPNGLQAKLTINEAGDQYEQEADRVAEQVMRM